MAVVVTPDDVAAGWRPLTLAEVSAAEGLITEAGVLLAALVPDLDSKDEGLVRLVVARMVRRVLKNPDGWRIAPGLSIDDYTESGGTRDNTLSTGEMYISDLELSWLGVEADSPGAFEIVLGGS
ncbi:hypothetical protein [Paenarthrobacter sp. CAP02]|uniref:hypothetical protein n=1 Tax=Paenarthrobacter sp. CAP02 TaxID=3158144 RepID=UPI0032DB22B8